MYGRSRFGLHGMPTDVVPHDPHSGTQYAPARSLDVAGEIQSENVEDIKRGRYIKSHAFALEQIKLSDVVNRTERSVVLICMEGEISLPLGSGTIIARNLVLTSCHSIEGFDVRRIFAAFSFNQGLESSSIRFTRIVEYNARLDYAILELAALTLEANVALINYAATPFHSVVLLHHPNGDYKKVSTGRVLSSRYQQLSLQAFIHTDVISSGGGYFSLSGELLAIHLTVGQCGYSPIRSALLINRIIEEGPNGLLNKIVNHQSIAETLRLTIPRYELPITIRSEPSPLVSAEELRINVNATTPIRNRYAATTGKEEKYFFKAMNRGLVTDDLFVTGQQTLVSFGENGLFRRAQATQARNRDGVRIDFQGYTVGNRNKNYQAQMNGARGTGGTTIAHVSLNTVYEQVTPGSGLEIQVLHRLRYALYHSYITGNTYQVG